MELDPKILVRRWSQSSLVWLVIWCVVFFQSLMSAAHVWLVNDAFNHCFFIVPAVIYGLWLQRGALLAQPVKYSWLFGFAVLGSLFVYALGLAAYVEVLQHMAMFALLPFVFGMLFGWRAVFKVWPLLAFVLFAIPVGEELVPLFQDITAYLAINLLEFFNVPVHRDGLYIYVPNGSFVVAEACSGIRFFIACVVIGCAYAYLNCLSYSRALIIVLFSIIMPILANGVRAFGIILIGHLSNMEHAVGADHLVFGWVFFAFVIVLLLIFGHFVSDGHRQWESEITSVDGSWLQCWNKKTLALAVAPLIMVLGIQVLLNYVSQSPFSIASVNMQSRTETEVMGMDWTPRFYNADHYRVSSQFPLEVQYFQAVYQYNNPEGEMISWANRLYDIDLWSAKGRYVHSVPGFADIRIVDLTAVSGNKRLLAYWYVVANRVSSKQVYIKLQQAVNSLALFPSGGALVAVSMPYNGDTNEAIAGMRELLNQQARTLSSSSESNQ